MGYRPSRLVLRMRLRLLETVSIDQSIMGTCRSTFWLRWFRGLIHSGFRQIVRQLGERLLCYRLYRVSGPQRGTIVIEFDSLTTSVELLQVLDIFHGLADRGNYNQLMTTQ